MATEAGKHVDLYTRKGLLQKLPHAEALAEWMLSKRGVVGAGEGGSGSGAFEDDNQVRCRLMAP